MAAREDQALAVSWPGELPFTADLLRQVIARHAPVIRFHPEEPYFPSTVDWYLKRSLLIDGATGAVVARHPAAADLPKGPTTPDQLQHYWLTLDPDIAGPAFEPDLAPPDDPRRGNLADARAYVRALHNPKLGHTDLQFWMFYPYDGPGLTRLRPRFLGALRTDRVLSLWPAGMHEADWELAVIRIDHATLQPVAAFLSQHQNGDQHVGADAVAALEREPDGRIRLHASLYGHASYAHPQERKLVYFKRSLALVGIELGLIDRAEPGSAWNLGQNHEVISTSWHDPQFPEAPWLDFAWRWGAYDPTGGRFRRKLVEALGDLLESHLSPPVLVLHVLTLGLTAVLLALAPRLLGGPLGAKLLGHTADNSGPFGPSCHDDKWSGNYGFTGPPAQPEWLGAGTTLAQRIGSALNTVCSPPVRLLGSILRVLCTPLLPKD
ncbi:MAG: Vps62-related protein [Pseudomonadota bacterium]|nr:Vps62-related protein [Pseudomonadota bacterium]